MYLNLYDYMEKFLILKALNNNKRLLKQIRTMIYKLFSIKLLHIPDLFYPEKNYFLPQYTYILYIQSTSC